MTLPDLTPDCANCDALCCVLLAFDASEAFAIDKPACTACPNLAGDNRCTIHASLNANGFKGCVTFDCHGAGQRFRKIFKRSWRDDPALMPAMDQAFRSLRQCHETLTLLLQAANLPLTPAQESTRQSLLETLAKDRTAADLLGPEPQAALTQARAYFASLRGAIPRR